MIAINRLIDERPLSGLQLRTIFLCGLVVLLDGFDIQTMALAVNSIVAEWSVPPSQFTTALTAGPIGMAIGAFFLAPFGDRIGRRNLLIAAMAVAGLASIGTATSNSFVELEVWRFLTGLGLGSSLPNATTLTSEFVPAPRRAALITLMYCNVALGALLAGFVVAPPVIEQFGWRGLFWVGGIIPLVICVLLTIGLPESVRFLLARRPKHPRIAQVLRSMAPDVNPADVYAEQKETTAAHQSVRELLAPTYRARTLLLWSVCCLNLFVLYFLISWLGPMLKGAGWSIAQAARGSVMIQLGGIIGGFILSYYVDHGRTVAAMVSAYLLTAVALGLFTVIPSDSGGWWALLIIIGSGTSGSQFALNALAAAFYPPVIRATGVGASVGVGRIGAIVGPLVGGWIVSLGMSSGQTLGLFIIPVVVCASSVLLLPRVWKPD